MQLKLLQCASMICSSSSEIEEKRKSKLHKKLSPVDQELLAHLRRVADRLRDERYSADRSAGIDQKYELAKRELNAFLAEKRAEGINV